jgi:hypothetical protein
MFISKKEVLNQSLTSNSFSTLKKPQPFLKSYSPMNISILSLSPKQKLSRIQTRPNLSSLKPIKKTMQKRTNSSFPMPKFSLSMNKASNKPSIIQTILDYKSKVSIKYSKYFMSLSQAEENQVEYENILNYLRMKQFNKEIKSALGQSESTINNIINNLARSIMKTFDINSKLAFGIDEFLAVCSVHEIFFNDSVFSLLNSSMLCKLKEKVDELKVNYQAYNPENGNKVDFLLGIVNTWMGHKDRRSFVGFIKNSSLNFTLYLQILPIFLNLENAYF